MNPPGTVGTETRYGFNFFVHLSDRAAVLNGWRRSLLGFSLGVLAAGALPPAHGLPLLIPAFAGLLWLISAARSPWRATLSGWWFGFGHFLAACYWVSAALMTDPDKFTYLSVPAVIGLAAGLALFPALAALAVSVSRQSGFNRILLFAVAWTATEWLRGTILSGFPMNLIGTAWTVSEGMIQMAAVTGAYGLSFVTILAAGSFSLLAEPLQRGMAARNWRAPATMIIVLTTIWLGGTIRLSAQNPIPVKGVDLLIVQPNIPQKLKWREDTRKAALEKHMRMTHASMTNTVSHVIWPETAVPYNLSQDPSLADWLSTAVPKNGLLITGAIRRRGGEGSFQLWNSLHAVDSNGMIRLTYDKHHLVPFGEYMPLRSIMSLAKLTYGNIDFSSGPGTQTLEAPGLPPVSPLICYEAIFPGRVIYSEARPGWMLNITNDGWFGNTAGPYQHLQSARLRAVEEGLPLVRAANTGISAVIDPLGRYVGRLSLGAEGVLHAPLPSAIGRTPYAVMGDLTLIIMLIVSIGVVMFRVSYTTGYTKSSKFRSN